MRLRIFNTLILVSVMPFLSAEEHGKGITLKIPEKMSWKDGPASLPKGAQIAILEGDPSKEGPFVFRVKVPEGYQIPPHTHPKMERVSVISGTFNIGMGAKFDKEITDAMPAGSYGYWEPGMKHFVWTKGETIAQFHGMGPWTIQYVNPADDPRNQKRNRNSFIMAPFYAKFFRGHRASLTILYPRGAGGKQSMLNMQNELCQRDSFRIIKLPT